MNVFPKTSQNRGFTLIELLVVIGIIGVLSSIVMMSVNDSRVSGRDAAKKTQIQEVLKSLELYYTDNQTYPFYGVAGVNTGGPLSGIQPTFYGIGRYLNRLPDEAATNYHYCVSADRRSIVLAVNTERDFGGSNYCHIIRGPGPHGCVYTSGTTPDVDADDPCSTRF
jgi:prepilin-type N-terminal cleavage/methylation domain-containing protein